ncbi:DUF1266 domain-containing protein [Nocardiopsis algeriensis]|uniref:DUF1266 domain-containing protein n=1 Tax=Nocardiopsis algeriensis TaxID=1478215 RepID=A0A841IR79_9ACTN|nr:hypothetical protein [Nocardiopsis algeriensis]
MLTAVAGIFGALVIGAWVVVAWGSGRRQPWLLAPLALLVVLLVVMDMPGWSFLPAVALVAGTFTELVLGVRESPAVRTKDPDAPLSTERWAAAVAAPFRVALAEPWDVVAQRTLRRRYRRMLEHQWQVTDRESLVAAFEAHVEELRTGSTLDLVVDLGAGIARSRLPREEGGMDTGEQVRLTPEQVERLREVTGAVEGDETVIIGAYQWWRSVHAIRLVCAGASLDWLSPVETQTMLRRVASDLQRRYASWQQLSTAFHAGYLLWPNRAAGDEDGGTDRVWTALGLLTEDPRSPWNLLPWDMPLERVLPEGGTPGGQEQQESRS